MSEAVVFSYKPSLLRRPVECRVGPDEVELLKDGAVQRRIAYSAVTEVHWVELSDEYQGNARRSLLLKGRGERLYLLQKDGFTHGPVQVGPFYAACAEILRALAARQPDAGVYFGSRGGARVLYAIMMLPTAVIALMLIAKAFEEAGSLAGGLLLGALGVSFLVTTVWFIRRLRLGRPTPKWRAGDLAAEMALWAREAVDGRAA